LSKKILFISHDATRTGAPILLLDLLKWLKANSPFEFEILLRRPGPLVEKFAALAPVRIAVIPQSLRSLIKTHGKKRGLSQWLRSTSSRVRTVPDARSGSIRSLVKYYKKYDPDLIYSNTVVNGDLLSAFSVLDCPAISHIHELDNIISLFGEKNWQEVSGNTDRYIVASSAVRQNLIDRRGVSPESIDTVFSFVDTRQRAKRPEQSKALRESLGIPREARVICGSGLDEWRKGMDLFIRCAGEVVARHGSKVHFLWVGGWLSEEARLEHLELARKLNVDSHITFTGMVDNPLDFYELADMFTLTSREDPFPLVCLEAASLGMPVLCFDEAGGMPVFVEDDAGFIVPFKNISAMAGRISELMDDPALRKKLGARAREKVMERYDIEVGSRKILEIISSTLLPDPELG